MEKPFFFHALKIDEEQCIGCSHCMNRCPTEAIRVWNGKAIIDDNLCVDCGECESICPVKAIYVEDDDFDEIFKFKYRVALIPSVFVGQFPEHIKASQVYSIMHQIGFTHVYELERAVGVLNEVILDYQKKQDIELPVISSFCPSIVRLIQVKYPSLVDNILRLVTPSDLAAAFYKKKMIDEGIPENEIGLFYITPCAAKIAAIKCPVGEKGSLVNGVFNLNKLFNLVYREIKSGKTDNCIIPEPTVTHGYKLMWSLTRGEASRLNGRTLAIDGISNVMEFLEMVENEEVTGIDYLECRACKEGCAGGILNKENRFLVVERLKKRIERNNGKKGEMVSSGIAKYRDYLEKVMKVGDIEPRSMMMLDADMGKAMRKMEEAVRIEKRLPGIDCGACGAPSCRALAEDVVKGDATLSHCVFVQKVLMSRGEINMETAFAIIDKIWGDKAVKGSEIKKKKNL